MVLTNYNYNYNYLNIATAHSFVCVITEVCYNRYND